MNGLGLCARALRELVLARRVSCRVLCLLNQFEVREMIVAPVSVPMVNIMSGRNRTVGSLPYIPVQKGPTALGAPIVASVTQRVPVATEINIRERLGSRPQGPSSQGEHLVDALSAHAERLRDMGQAETLLVEIIHRLRFWIISMCWHNISIPERLSVVNHCRGPRCG